jgi:hypothetical protein
LKNSTEPQKTDYLSMKRIDTAHINLEMAKTIDKLVRL